MFVRGELTAHRSKLFIVADDACPFI